MPILVSNRNQNETQCLQKRRLNRYSGQEYQDVSSSIPIQPPPATRAFTSIPDELISRVTLNYVGFSEAKANELWNIWVNWPPWAPPRETYSGDDELQMTFIDFVTSPFLASSDNLSDEGAAWKTYMDEYGLNTEIQRAILDPMFECFRLDDSCALWAKDIIKMRYKWTGRDLWRVTGMRRSTRHANGRPSQSSTEEAGVHLA
ncbi:hypothetical protein EDB81DRAFT_882637 [Dactylonectria macrodidyma]|uniref:Uncharacterized protein n=1 Tax=Dactylonectria macrodidyma TaxID=307937 RepID=A0A9P9EY20_9HYPO|nr:hypothetical protein EDB81DRAFT_882637 [Dactylonectria macrodidyma]